MAKQVGGNAHEWRESRSYTQSKRANERGAWHVRRIYGRLWNRYRTTDMGPHMEVVSIIRAARG
eukprot:6206746-Pleurochrysis_carterae.AAC.1